MGEPDGGALNAASTSGRASLIAARKEAFDRGDCGNGPDEYGNWPCDPQVLLGGEMAECRVCGRVAKWPKDDPAWVAYVDSMHDARSY